jgi:amino acid transporter
MGLLESTFFLAVSLLKFGQALTIVCDTHKDFEFLWWCAGYVVMMYFHLKGGSRLWSFVAITTLVTFLGLVVYLIGSIPAIDFPKYAYANASSGFAGNTVDYLLIMRLPCWLFVGIDFLSLSSEETKHVSAVVGTISVFVAAIVYNVTFYFLYVIIIVLAHHHHPLGIGSSYINNDRYMHLAGL